MTDRTTAESLINRSASHGEIVTATITTELWRDMLPACDDYTEANGVHEFWGTTDAGADWRVHLIPPRD